MEFSIREAAESEAETIVRILGKSFTPVAERFGLTPDNCPSHPSFAKPNWIEWEFEHDGRYFLGCRPDGSAIACVSIMGQEDGSAELRRVATIPECQKQGIGERMVAHAEGKCLEMGFRRAEIGIIAKQEELHQWYRDLGYRDARRQSFPQLPFLVQFMAKDLA